MNERLVRDARHFSFFQLVKQLLRGQPGAVSPGEAGPPEREPIRFRPAASLAFPASDVASVESLGPRGEHRTERYRVTVNFMGLYGPASPMPNHFTEEILWAGREGRGARDFIDLFNHRMISFVHRSWEKYRFPEQFRADPLDPFTERMFCLLGLGTSGMREAAGVEPPPLLRTAALLSSRQRSAAGLECLLRAHFPGAAVRVEPCIARKVRIPPGGLMQLGRRGARLGEDACLGERVSDRSGTFRIVLGPMLRPEFDAFLPLGERLARLVRLTRLYVVDPLDFEVLLLLKESELPALRLLPGGDLPLGQASWIRPTGRQEGRGGPFVRTLDPLARRASGQDLGTGPDGGLDHRTASSPQGARR
jgi:type VI secretion system protein ImpH